MKKQYENPIVEIELVDDIDILTCSADIGDYCPENDDTFEDWE